MHFERQNAFQNALNFIFFPEKKLAKMCVPTLPTFFYPFPETQLLFYLALASLDVY